MTSETDSSGTEGPREADALAPPPRHSSETFAALNAPTPAFPRPFAGGLSGFQLADYHAGVMNFTYKGFSCLKSPIDLAIYMQMIWDLKPGTIIEIGSYHGGAALFYEDLCNNFGLETRIVTVDHMEMGANQKDATPSGSQVEFVQADATDLAGSALHTLLDELPRPWLVIEDSAHTRDVSLAVIDYFADRMVGGEYLIIEDGVIEALGANHLYGGGPNLAVHDFFVKRPGVFEVDPRYNDFFGRNMSFNPNGYLRKL